MARKTGSHSEVTGPRIRAVALHLFARHGYAAVSMRQIAREVGVQAGALYLYTPDKQGLLFGLLRDHMLGLVAAWKDEEKPTDPVKRLRCFTRFHIYYHLQRPDEVFVSYMELRNLSVGNFATIETMRRSYEDELQAILKDGQVSGQFLLPDTKLATLALIAMLTGVNTWYRAGGRLNCAKIEAIYWDMVCKAVSA